jgi:hypothetical protein
MRQISNAAVHEAGHALVAHLLGIQIDWVYVGYMWDSDEKGLISFKHPTVRGRVVRGECKSDDQQCIIKAAGLMTEIMWGRRNPHPTREERIKIAAARMHDHTKPAYANDFNNVPDPVSSMFEAEKLLFPQWEELKALARYLNMYPNQRLYGEEFLDILQGKYPGFYTDAPT